MSKLELGKANLEVFSETLIDLTKKDKDIIVVTSDSRGSGKLVPFAEQLPDQIVEVGIAEQNLVGVSAGLASTGKKAFAVWNQSGRTGSPPESRNTPISFPEELRKIPDITRMGLFESMMARRLMDVMP